jgi:NAD+ synthase (glutamine-hydrolysing)
MRYFTPWYIEPGKPGLGELQEYFMPRVVRDVTQQKTVPIGIFAIAATDTALGFETCEELFTPRAPHLDMSLDGVEIIANGSGSHHQLRKLDTRLELVRSATAKAGGIYLYANQKGCDGGRMYFDGCAMVWLNGKCVAQGSQFEGLAEVEMVVATVSLADVRSARSNFIARSFQSSSSTTIPRVRVDFCVCAQGLPAQLALAPSAPFAPRVHSDMEEIALGPSNWLWDYLRRSGMRGYFLPLSGGADSSATAALVAIMCQRVVAELTDADEASRAQTLEDVRRVTRDAAFTPRTAQELCGRIFVTAYMGSEYSGDATRARAAALAAQIGALHTSIRIDAITDAIKRTFGGAEVHSGRPAGAPPMRTEPQLTNDPARVTENLALQNIQARSRMVMAYFMGQLMPWATDASPLGGGLLVLGSANVDEALRGYYTKHARRLPNPSAPLVAWRAPCARVCVRYDCSAADINPIGGINKRDLKAFLQWASTHRGIGVLADVAVAAPSAELTGAEGAQLDEDDMGMSYAELADLGHCRKVEHCGPLSTYLKLRRLWAGRTLTRSIAWSVRGEDQSAWSHERRVAQKVKDFYYFQALNRHKMTTLTPSYHAENYSPDDNRFDLRPFLCNLKFERQFAAIDAAVAAAESGVEEPEAKRHCAAAGGQ